MSQRDVALLDDIRTSRPRRLGVDRMVLRNGCPTTAAYILFWAHLFWALGLALSGEAVAAMYDHFPARQLHVWDGLALVAAVLLRLGIGRGNRRVIQVGAGLGFVLWGWADVAFFLELGPATGLVYTALAGASAWVVYLTGDAWVSR